MVRTPEMSSAVSSSYQGPGNSGDGYGTQVNSDMDSIGSDFSIVPSSAAESMVGNGHHEFVMNLSQAQSEVSMNDMYMTIQQLMNENHELKQTVQRDHEAMKSQFEIMLNAKDQIESIMKDQLDKREQAKLCIEQLRSENASLKDEVAQIQREKVIAYECQVRELKDALENQKILYHQLKADNDELLVDCNQLKQSYDMVMIEKSEIVADYAELKIKFDELSRLKDSPNDDPSFQFVDTKDVDQLSSSEPREEDENARITEIPVRTLNVAAEVDVDDEHVKSMQSAERSIKNLLTQIDVEQGKSNELSAVLENEKLKNGELEKRVEGQNEIIRQLSEQQSKIQNDEKHLENHLQDSERKFAMANSYLQKYKDRCDSLETWLNVYQGKLDTIKGEDDGVVLQLRGEVQDLRKTLEDEKRRSEEDKKQLEEERLKNATLMEEHLQLKNTWETMFPDENQVNQTEAYHLLQIKAFQEREDSIHAKLVTLEERLRNKEEECEASHVEILRLKSDVENVPLLKAQLDVYKIDFEEERRCREQLHGEKEQLVQDLMRLRSERSTYQTSQSTVLGPVSDDPWTVAEPNAPVMEAVGEANDVVRQNDFVCPKCNFSFDSFQPLLNHVNNCLDTDN